MRRRLRARTSARRSTPAAIAAGIAALLVATVVAPLPAAAADAQPAYVTLVKTATPAPPTALAPGDLVTFNYSINCSSDVADCVDLRVTDVLPAPLLLESATIASSSGGTAATGAFETTADSFELTFTSDLGGGQIGLPDGYSVDFVATARVPLDAAADFDGQTLVSRADATLAYSPSNTSDDAEVLLAVPTVLSSSVDKAADPTTVPAIAGRHVDYRFEAANTSNTAVDGLVVQDPAGSGTDPYRYLAPTAIEVPAWPAGADRIQVDWFDGTAWRLGSPTSSAAVPDLAAGEAIAGLRFTFSSSTGGTLPRAATAEVVVETALRDSVSEIDPSHLAQSTASSWVRLGADSSTPATDAASVRIDRVTVNPVASKLFSPNSVVGGRDVEVTVRAQNGGDFTLGRLTVTEPAPGTATLVEQGLGFADWVDAEVEWPVGATAAEVSYHYAGDADYSAAVAVAPGATLPEPVESEGDVLGVRVSFTGSMAPGQYAELPFTATTGDVAADVTTTDTVAVDAETVGPDVQSATTTATDELTRRTARVATTLSKSLAPESLYAIAGATTVVSLTARVAPAPTSPGDTGGSTIGAERLVVTDSDLPGGFWDDFALGRILATDVPAGSRLTVEYWDSSAAEPGWTALTAPVTGPELFAHTLTGDQRDALAGVRFVYEPTAAGTELPPGFTVRINLRAALLEAAIDDAATEPYALDNDATASVENVAATPSSDSRAAAADVTLIPFDAGSGPGGIDMVDKRWVEDPVNGVAVNARSAEEARATMSWSTAGVGFDSVLLSDTAADPAAAGFDVASSVFDAFDLVRIPAITTGMDALLTYDRIAAVELYLPGSGWVPAAGDPCAGSGCDGRFPGYTLTTAEREQAIGVRLLVEESPTRAARLDADDPFAPPVGSGVAATMLRDRAFDLVFAVRDERRSNGDPVLGSNRGTQYNADAAGWVDNSVLIEGRDADGAVLHDDAAEAGIQILDRPLNVTVTKEWVDGPLGVPPVDTPSELYPTARMTLTATNATVVRVDELSIVEPGVVGGGAAPDPFEYVDLSRIVSISVPAGAESTLVHLEPAASHPDSPYTVGEALALSRAALAEVEGIRVEHSGRIEAGASSVVVLDTQLRRELRSAPGTAVGPEHGPVANSAIARVSDLGGYWADEPPAPAPGTVLEAVAADSAELGIAALEYGVVATKGIRAGTDATDAAPAIQYDGASPIATVTLGARPTGNVRTTTLELEDASPTFWNAFVFDGFAAHSFAAPIDRVQVDALVGAAYSVGADNALEVTGGTWVEGVARTSLALPTGVTPSEVLGLRFTYFRADGAAWERPFNPEQRVSFRVERRDALLTGGPVPSTLYIHDPGVAPGETERATFSNAVSAVVSAVDADGDVQWTATDGDAKRIRYQHLPAHAQIRMTPAGPIALGDTVDYVVEVRNLGQSGDKPLSGVVVTTLLPVDPAGEPYLVFPENPDTAQPFDPTDPAQAARMFEVELRDADGDPLPAPAMTVDLDAVPTADDPSELQPQLTFTLAPGETIPLGATLTIGAPMQFRALLEAGTRVESTATLTSDQEFDSCGEEYVDGADVGPGAVESPECATSTTVWPLPSAPLTIAQGVRGLDAGPLAADGETPLVDGEGAPFDDLGVAKVVPSSPIDCSAPNTTIEVNGGGYYRYPCVPITRPGSTHEWAAAFTNSGNVSVRQIVAIDVLPAPGDTGITIPSARNSQWTAKLSSYPVAHGLPAGAALTVYALDETGVASARCNGADIQATMGMTPSTDPPMLPAYQPCLTDTAAVDDVADRAWTELSTDPAAWASVVALKFVIAMDDSSGLDRLLPPGGTVSITYDSTTALVPEVVEPAATLGRDAVAYNSIAGAAVGRLYPEGEPVLDLAYRLVTEPRKAGVALAVGSVELLKLNEGAAASYAPSSVALELACEVDGQPIALLGSTGADRSTVTATPGSPVLVRGIPLYAECAVTEPDDYGQSARSVDPDPMVLVAHADHAVGEWPVSDPRPPFGVDGADEPYRPAIERATVTNEYDAASLVVSKTVDTNGAVNHLGQPVVYTAPQFTVQCRFDNGSTNPIVFSSGTFSLASGASVTFPRPSSADPVLPAGAVCTVTESNSRNATTVSHTVTTADGAGAPTTGTSTTVTLTPDDAEGAATNSVAFLNDYGVGSFTVDKELAGLGAARYGTGIFDISVTCTRSSASPSTVWTGTFELSSSTLSHTIENLPAGSVCTVTEPDRAGATSTSFSPQQPGNANAGRATVPNGGTATVRVTNTFDLARLAITKDVRTDAVDQDGAPVYPTDVFDVEVACTFQGTTVLADGFGSSPMLLDDLARAETRTLTGLPAGASCAVTEVAIPADVDSTSIQWTTSAGSGSAAAATASFVLSRDSGPTTGTNAATVVNRYDVASLTVRKDVRGGAGAQFGTGPFLIDVECVAPGSIVAFDDTVALPTPGGQWFTTIEDLPEGAECSVAETNADAAGADASRVLDADGAEFDGTGIAITTAEPGEVTIENWYLTGSVVVSKQTEGDGADGYGAGPFEVTLACERDVAGTAVAVDGYPLSRSLVAGGSTTFTGLPSGAECTLTETGAAGASSSRIVLASDGSTELAADATAGHAFTVAVDASSLVDDQPQPALEVVNRFRLAGLVVTKTVQSDAVDASGAAVEYGPFPVEVSCTFEGEEIFADGYSVASPMRAELSHGGPAWELAGLAVGAECSVTETDRMGSAASRIAVTPSGGSTATTLASAGADSVSADIVLAPRSAEENLAAIRNDFDSGSIELAKVVDGLGADWATEGFELVVECSLDGAAGDGVVWSETYAFERGDPAVTLADVAAGADCTVAETRTGGATATSVDVDGDVTPATSAAFATTATTTEVTVTNRFDVAEVAVVKDRIGDGVALWGDGPFEVALTCERDVDGTAQSIDPPGGATRLLTAAGLYRATFESLPAGAECELVETRTGGANESSVAPGAFALENSSTAVSVENRFATGSVEITKERIGEGVALYGSGPFEVTLTCERDVDGTATAVPIPGGATRELTAANGYVAEFADLPTDADCGLVESATAGATTSGIDEPEFSIGDATVVPVEVTNAFHLVLLRVTNVVTGGAAEPMLDDDFVIELSCELDVDGELVPLEIPDGAERTFKHAESVEYASLPAGAECRVVETDDRGANLVITTHGGLPLDLVTLPLEEGEVVIDVVNVFLLADTGVGLAAGVLLAVVLLAVGIALVWLRRRPVRQD